MSVGSINNDSIRTGIHQSLHTIQCIGSHTYTGSYAQTAFGILASHRFILCFCNIFIGNKTYQFTVLIYHRQFFNLMFLQNLRSSLHVSGLVGSHNVLLRHYLINTFVHILLKTKVTVRHNTYQISFIVYYRDTADSIFRHQRKCISHSRSSLDSYGIINHTVFRTFHYSYLTCLFFNRHVFVNHTDPPFTGNGNGHFRFRNRIHSGSHKGNFQLDVA